MGRLDRVIESVVAAAERMLLRERWSDEARAASIIARRLKMKKPGFRPDERDRRRVARAELHRATPRRQAPPEDAPKPVPRAAPAPQAKKLPAAAPQAKAKARAAAKPKVDQKRADLERRIRQLDRKDTPDGDRAASALRKLHRERYGTADAKGQTSVPAEKRAPATKKKLPWEGGERAEARPGDHELEAVRSAMGRDERDAFDRGYKAWQQKGHKGSRADYMHDVGKRYQTETEGNSTAETWLSGDSVERLKKITDYKKALTPKRKKRTKESALDRMIAGLIRESDRAALGSGTSDQLMEKWSDAARAASLAARRAKAGGKDWRKAGRDAYRKAFAAGGLKSHRMLDDAMSYRRPGEAQFRRRQTNPKGGSVQKSALGWRQVDRLGSRLNDLRQLVVKQSDKALRTRMRNRFNARGVNRKMDEIKLLRRAGRHADAAKLARSR